jgi:hypothetical protein
MALATHDGVQRVLEAAGLDRAVDAALLGSAGLPPPAPDAAASPGTIARVRGAQPIDA